MSDPRGKYLLAFLPYLDAGFPQTRGSIEEFHVDATSLSRRIRELRSRHAVEWFRVYVHSPSHAFQRRMVYSWNNWANETDG